MKILILAAGNDIHTVRWCNQLSENQRNEVHLCYVSNQKPSIDAFSNKVFLHELKYPSPYGYYLNIFELKKIIKKIKPNILNTHYASGYGTLGRISRFSPHLISVYGSDVYDFPYQNRFNMRLITKNLKNADSIASTSNAMAIQVTKLIECELEDIHITPFGVDVKKFHLKSSEKRDNEFVIGSIKKLSAKYGIKYGILAVNYLIKDLLTDEERSRIKLKYNIYGEGEEKSDLQRLVSECGLEEIVVFKGKIANSEVPKALNELDVFLGTSILDSESFGVAIVEAMACQVPVIVTDVDGFKEVVDNGKAGIIVSRKNFIEMAEQILKLLRNPKLRIEIGEKQRKHVMNRYDWIENVKKMESIYELIEH
ncbi:glycosyltransferase [Paenibacillus sp. RS8]|uniref:glycosyltransferase n=1 Tax=Paenibacillus sp. RS8 TaxID=3242681 RepID=UPI0035C21DC6